MSLPRAVQTSWTPHPGAPRSSGTHLHWKHLLQGGRVGTLAGQGEGLGLGGWGAASGVTSWALPLPLVTADLEGGVLLLFLPTSHLARNP